MRRLPVAVWISNAAAVLCGRCGDVTQHADTVGCSRQTIYQHAERIEQAVTDLTDGGPTLQEWLMWGIWWVGPSPFASDGL